MRTFVIIAGLTAGITLLTINSSGQAPASNSQNNTNKTQGVQKRTASPMKSMRAKNSAATSDLLAASNQALEAARRQDRTDALFHVNHALENANKVSASGNTKLVPIYTELTEYSVLQPILEARGNESRGSQSSNNQATNNQASNNQSKNGTAQNSTNSADRTQANPAAQGATVQRVTGEITSVSLDVSAAKQHLEGARTALNSSDFEKAESALVAVQTGLVIQSVATDMPLLRARRNLIIARDQAMEGNTQAAQAAFKEAGEALNAYGQTNSSHAQDVQKLKSEIDSFSQSLKNDTNNIDTKVEGWWDQVTGWIPESSAASNSQR